MRFVNGVGARTGIMGIDYPTAMWLYRYVNNIIWGIYRKELFSNAMENKKSGMTSLVCCPQFPVCILYLCWDVLKTCPCIQRFGLQGLQSWSCGWSNQAIRLHVLWCSLFSLVIWIWRAVSLFTNATFPEYISLTESLIIWWVKIRQRTPQFIVQAYLAGPKNVNLQETGHHWLNFEKAVTYYEPKKK